MELHASTFTFISLIYCSDIQCLILNHPKVKKNADDVVELNVLGCRADIIIRDKL